MKKIIAGNWKMNNLKKDIDTFVINFKKLQHHINFDIKEVLIAPASPYFYYFKTLILKENININLGFQNCFYEDKGAFTGEVSPLMIQDLDADFVIIGHSERRHIFNESNEMIQKKVNASLSKKIKTILCIGETLEQRERGITFQILKEQLDTAFKTLPDTNFLIIAYEPVWAIGTGKTANSEQIKEVHLWLREYTKKNIANNIPLLYGGSVKPANINSIMKIENVNGVLVGGASLKVEDFIQIINFDKEN